MLPWLFRLPLAQLLSLSAGREAEVLEEPRGYRGHIATGFVPRSALGILFVIFCSYDKFCDVAIRSVLGAVPSSLRLCPKWPRLRHGL